MNTSSEYKLISANNSLRQAIIDLLQENDLPVSDLDESKELFAIFQNDEIVGTGGLEFFGNCALLRSVSVRKDLQRKGLGKIISRELEKISKQRGVDCLYLLTTTAKTFFINEGYEVINREEAPLSIKHTSEFTSLCPSSATVMRKILT
ncbi:MAG TPA: arsenic resistance N-acetyltransferase ArsN2 [Chitinophagaceae bacterium]|jgi:amino-acid N-acetyltransferase|nr:arsenic resistance N-acetyltransferase ArsN2 [Chitinophagaceae bacterium]